MNKSPLLGVLFLACVILTGCAPSANKGPIKIGVIAPLAGGAAVYGEDATHAYNYILDKVNANGGINGRQVELIYEDGKCGGKEATAAVQKLINVDQVTVILGGTCSSETIPAGKIAQQNGVVMVSSTSSSPDISSIGNYVFRYWNDLTAGAFLANYLADNDAENIAIIVENNDYSVGYGKVVEDNFEGNIVLNEKINADEKDLSIIAKKIADIEAEVDYIVFVSVTESLTNNLYAALDNEEILETIRDRIVGGEAILNETTLGQFGDKLDGMKTVILSELKDLGGDAVTITEEITDGYEVKSSDVFVLLWADGIDLVLDAIAEVGEDSAAIQQYIASFTADNPRESFFGDFYFDENGDGQGLTFTVMQAQNGELVAAE